MNGVRHAVDVAPFGGLADPRVIARIARAAEASGWDGLSVWDSLGRSIGSPTPDPFVALAAAASVTDRLRLITSVVALPRRRPQLVAQSAASLHRWSGGRLVLGVGAGGDAADFEPFGEPFDADRIARLDHGLEALDGYLREALRDTANGSAARPDAGGPPRPPIWLGGDRPGAIRRAARWDGWIVVATSEDGASMALDPSAVGAMVERLRSHRDELGRRSEPFDVAVFGFTEDDPGLPARYATVGATWWLESLSPMRGSLGDLLAIVESGPPGSA